MAVSGDTIAVGAVFEDSNATGVNGDQIDNSMTNSGAVYVFTRTGTNWAQQAYLKASNTGSTNRFGSIYGDEFGHALSLAGDTLVVGARNEASNAIGVNGDESDNSALSAGAAYVLVRTGSTWTQQAYLKASNTRNGSYFGWSVAAVSGDGVLVGASSEWSNATGVNGDQTNFNATASGAAYLFTRSDTNWSQVAYLKASNTEAYDGFGVSVAGASDLLVVGASGEDSNATGVNGDQSDNSASSAGAAYVFSITATPPRLNLQRLGNSVVLSWTNTAFGLQSAPTISGTFTNVPGATSPYTNPASGGQQFFRLSSN